METSRITTIWRVLICCILNHIIGCATFCDQEDVKHVALSLTPAIKCSYLSLGHKGVSIEWSRNSNGPDYYLLDGSSSPEVNTKHGFRAINFYPITDKQLPSYKLCLKAIVPTSEGNASLLVELDNLTSTDLSTGRAGRVTKYDLSLDANLDYPGKNIQDYILSWTSQQQAAPNSPYLVLIYSRSSMSQFRVEQPHISLKDLDAGNLYKFCVISSRDVCKGTEWSCTTRLLPLPKTAASSYRKEQNWVQELNLVGTGATSVQVSWPVPIYTIHTKPSSKNRFYALSVVSYSGYNCELSIFYLQAPWVQAHELLILKGLIDEIKQDNDRSKKCSGKKEERLAPLGNWPDWEHFFELRDERTISNEFIVTIPNLRSDQEYTISLWPTKKSIKVKTSKSAEDCQLQVKKKDRDTTSLHWTVPKSVLDMDKSTDVVFDFELSRINHISSRSLRDTCYSCEPNNVPTPTFSKNGQTLICQRDRVPVNLGTYPQQHSISCLTPCAVYDVRITLATNGTLRPNLFSCRKRWLHSEDGKGMKPQGSATALANNAVLLNLEEKVTSTDQPCTSIGHVVTLFDENQKRITQPMIYTTEDVLQGWQLPLLEPAVENNGRISYPLMLPTPQTKSSRITLEVQSFVCSNKDVESLTIPIWTTDQACHLDCVWSLPLASLSITHRSYENHGQHMAYLNDSDGYERCPRAPWRPDLQPTQCQTAPGFVYSDQTHCRMSSGWGTCSVPRCHEMAPIPCVTTIKPRPDTTSLFVSWTEPDTKHASFKNGGMEEAVETKGYVVTLSKPAVSTQGGTTCIQAHLINGNVRYPRFVNALLHSCEKRKHSETLNALFTNLTQNTSYEFRITAFNEYGRLGATWKQTLSTAEAKPCKPDNVQIENVEIHSVTVSGTEKSGANCGQATNALLTYYKPGSSSQYLNFSLREHPKWRIPYLDPCTRYCFTVSYGNHKGQGPESEEFCDTTKRQTFNGSPYFTYKCKSLAKSWYKQKVPASKDFISCHFLVHFDYTKFCQVHYQLEAKIFNGETTKLPTSTAEEFTVDDYFLRGLYYQVRIRALAPEYNELLRNDGSYSSQYSQMADLYTGMSDFEFKDLTVNVDRPKIQAGSLYCVSTFLSNYDRTGNRVVGANEDDYCFRVVWDIAGELKGLLGFVIQVFGEQRMKNNSSERATDNQMSINSDEVLDHTKNSCLRMIWIPCHRCLGAYDHTNARNKVMKQLWSMIADCSHSNPIHSKQRTYDRRVRIEEYLEIRSHLERMKSNTMPEIYPHTKTLDLLVTVSVPVSGLAQSSSNTNKMPSNKRKPRSLSKEDFSTPSGIGEEGFIRFYAVNTFDVELTVEQKWKLYAYTASNQSGNAGLFGLAFGILFVLVLLAIVCLLLFLNLKRKKYLAELRAADSGVMELNDEDEILQLNEKKPILPPKLTQFALRSPDPMSVHDFPNWFERQAFTEFEYLKDEFKMLKIHALRQEQSKRLTRDVGHFPENRLRNKYRNLIPFDQNYVHLLKQWRLVDINPEAIFAPSVKTKDSTSEEVEPSPRVQDELGNDQWTPSDYVNASLIRGHAPGVSNCLVGANHLPRVYIAAQAPISPTRALFWQMIWDHKVKLVILLTKIKEDSKEKCAQYWPGTSGNTTPSDDSIEQSKSLQLGHFTITLQEEVATQVYVTRKFNVCNTSEASGTPAGRTVTQLHMLKWPDYSAPKVEDFGSLLYAYWIERRCCASADAPVLIHCSAGIGRTGTFICLDQLCQQVRLYLQPDFQPLGVMATTIKKDNWEEPIYANLNDSGAIYSPENEVETKLLGEIDCGTSKRKTISSLSHEDANSSSHVLPLPEEPTVGPRRKIFELGKRKSQCIDVYKTVLWLRAHRAHMVQSEEQYLFLHRYLAYFIRKMNDYEPIYENI